MNNIVGHKMVCGKTALELTEKVNKSILDNYIPYGQAFSDTVCILYQAMIAIEDDDDGDAVMSYKVG